MTSSTPITQPRSIERSVLVVEDDEATAELERRVLSRSGASVRVARRLVDALDLLQRFSFDVILLDLRLPDGESWTIVDAANSNSPRIPVVLVTAMGDERVAAEAIHRGVDGYVKKGDRFVDELPTVVDRVTRLAALENALRRSEANFRALVERARDGIAVVRVRDGAFVYVNPSFLATVGVDDPEHLLGRPAIEVLVHPDHRGRSIERLHAMAAGRDQEIEERRLVGAAGETIWVEAVGVPVAYEGEPAVASVVRDITRRKLLEERLREHEAAERAILARTERELRTLIASAPVGMCLLRDERFSLVNETLLTMLQLEHADVVLGTGAIDLVHDDDRENTAARLRTGRSGSTDDFELRLRRADGSFATVQAAFVAAEFQGSGAMLGVLRDVTVERRLQAELIAAERRLARVDHLTGISNRLGAEEAFDRLSGDAIRRRGLLGLALLDVDHFKRINDAHGHEAGDRVLRSVADVLRVELRGADVAARWGGEELLALLPTAGLDGARIFAERVRAAIEERVVLETKIPTTVSIGISEFSHGDTLSALVARADERLYVAKTAGRNRVM